MPQASRKGDTGSGHGCFPPSSAISASPDVYHDGINALRKGDAVAPHGCKDCPPHGRSVSGGSPTVFINGRAAARIGDGIDCGGSMAAGSGTVFMDELDPVAKYPVAFFSASPCVRDCMSEASQKGQAFVAKG